MFGLLKIVAFIFTHLRIKVPELPGIKIDFLIIESDDYHHWTIGFSRSYRTLRFHLFIATLEIRLFQSRYVWKDRSVGEPVNMAACADHVFDVVFDECIELEKRVRRKLKIKEEERLGFSSSSSYNIKDKFLFVEPFIYVQLEDVKLPKGFVGRSKIREQEKQIEFDKLPFYQKVKYQDFWEK